MPENSLLVADYISIQLKSYQSGVEFRRWGCMTNPPKVCSRRLDKEALR
jgi:hypothetical protein